MIPLAVSWLPRKYGVEWIPGWPAFLSNLLTWLPVIGVWVYSLLKTLKQPLDEKFTKRKKALSALFFGSLCAFYIGISIFLGFFNQWRKVDRYISSPSGKNKAVVMVEKEKYGGDTEYIYPMRAWLFYEDNRIYLYPKYENITYTWLDDDTLEITHTRINPMEDGSPAEPETETLRW